MDYEAIDREASRAVLTVRIGETRFWVSDNDAETLTDIPANARRYQAWGDADDQRKRLSDELGYYLETEYAVSLMGYRRNNEA